MARLLAIAAAAALAALGTGPARAFELTFDGTTPPGPSPFSDEAFSGEIAIDLGAGITVVGGARDFYLIPDGDFSVSIGSTLASEGISAVRYPLAPGPRTFSIEVVAPTPDLARVAFVATPKGGSDPFASVDLRASLSALASGCCTAQLVVEPTSGDALSAPVESFAAVPEPSALLLSPLGIALLVATRMRRGHRAR